MLIHCCGCNKTTEANLVSGFEVYKHRKDLASLPFWQCPQCLNFVGCHHKTKDRTRPLGTIPTPEIKRLRMEIHSILDPMWKDGDIGRKELYSYLNKNLGYEYHTASMNSKKDYEVVMDLLLDLSDRLFEDS